MNRNEQNKYWLCSIQGDTVSMTPFTANASDAAKRRIELAREINARVIMIREEGTPNVTYVLTLFAEDPSA